MDVHSDEEESARAIEDDVYWKRRKENTSYRSSVPRATLEKQNAMIACAGDMQSSFPNTRVASNTTNPIDKTTSTRILDQTSKIVNIYIPKLNLRGTAPQIKTSTDSPETKSQRFSKPSSTVNPFDKLHNDMKKAVFKNSLFIASDTNNSKPGALFPKVPSLHQVEQKVRKISITSHALNDKSVDDHPSVESITIEEFSERSVNRNSTQHFGGRTGDPHQIVPERDDKSERLNFSPPDSNNLSSLATVSNQTPMTSVSRQSLLRDAIVNVNGNEEVCKANQTDYRCDICGVVCKSQVLLTSHVICFHEIIRKCGICGKEFWSYNEYAEHKKMAHDAYPYECGECGMTFRTESAVLEHFDTHRKKNYCWECKVCGKKQNSKQSWVYHIKKHLNDVVNNNSSSQMHTNEVVSTKTETREIPLGGSNKAIVNVPLVEELHDDVCSADMSTTTAIPEENHPNTTLSHLPENADNEEGNYIQADPNCRTIDSSMVEHAMLPVESDNAHSAINVTSKPAGHDDKHQNTVDELDNEKDDNGYLLVPDFSKLDSKNRQDSRHKRKDLDDGWYPTPSKKRFKRPKVVNKKGSEVKNTFQKNKRRHDGSKIQHTQTTDRIDEHACDFCGKSFATAEILECHTLVTHESGTVCNVCDEIFENVIEKTKHIEEKHEGYGYKCKTCKMLFQSSHLLHNHMRKHIGGVTYECPVCGYKTNRRPAALKHFEEGHQSLIRPISTKDNSKIEGTLNASVDQHENTDCKCEPCQIRFPTDALLKYHVILRHTNRLKCQICNIMFTTIKEKRAHDEASHKNQLVTCKQCGKVYKNLKVLKVHMKKHTTENIHKCPLCQKSFTLKYVLKRHIKTTHALSINCTTGIKSVDKIKSGKILTPYSPLTPTNDAFHTSQQLNHIVNGKQTKKGKTTKKFSCYICGRVYSQKKGLQQHFESKHNSDEDLKWKCNLCGKVFFSESLLNGHKTMKHSNAKVMCDICGKLYMRGDSLKKHKEKTHKQNE